MTKPLTYSPIQIALHWSVAVLVGLSWFTSDGMGRAMFQKIRGVSDGSWPLHVWIGLAVALLVIVRWALRLWRGTPGAPEGMTESMARLRKWGHWLLYALMILVPFGGIAAWFLGLRTMGEIHGTAGNLLLIVAGLHALVALFHHYVLRDETLTRMLRPGADVRT